MGKNKQNMSMTQPLKDALVSMYNSGGGKMRRPNKAVIKTMYEKGLLKNHNNLCWAWATYILSPTGVVKASDLCGY